MPNYEVKPVRNAIVMLTNQCNCACSYCFEERRQERMSLQTAKDTLIFIHSGHDPRPGFTFFGGEPMMEFNTIIAPLVTWSKYAFQTQTRFAMTTNGTLFTRERLDFLKENGISFMLSMDGGKTAQSGNRPLRNGGNSFDAVMEHIPYILKLWPMQSFRETLTQHNVVSFFDDILFFSSIGCKNLMVVPDLFETWSEDSIKTLQIQIQQYEEYILSGFRANQTPLLLHEYYLAFGKIMAAYYCKRDDVTRRSSDICASHNQCGFGVRGNVSIDPLGDIYGCHHIRPLNRDSIFYLGNIYDGIDESRVRNLVDQYDPQRVGGHRCIGCGLEWFCDGGCAPNNYQIFGDMHHVPDMYCVWQRMIVDSAHRIMTKLNAEGNQLFQNTFVNGIVRWW